MKPTVVDKSLKTDPVPNVIGFIKIDLSQDDSDDNLWKSNEKNDATNTTTSVQKHANASNKKKSSNTDAPSSVVLVVPKLSQSPPPSPSPSKPQTSCVFLNKRQRTRSTGVRHKV